MSTCVDVFLTPEARPRLSQLMELGVVLTIEEPLELGHVKLFFRSEALFEAWRFAINNLVIPEADTVSS